MGKRRFYVEMTATLEVELDDKVISAVDEVWRQDFYDLKTTENIVEHITYNLLQDSKLSQLDGWADQPDENAGIIGRVTWNSVVNENK